MMTAQNEITEIIGSFRELSGVGVCFYDLENFFQYNTAGAREYVGHYCELCKCVRLLNDGRQNCDISDRAEAVSTACGYRTPFFFRCHIGLCELVVPIYQKESLVGVIFLGQCRIPQEDYSADIGCSAAKLGGCAEQFVSLYDDLPLISRNALLSMGKILQLYFKNLTVISEFFSPEARESDDFRRPAHERIKTYIGRNFMKNISSRSISRQFYLNQSYLARDFKKHTGFTITEYICRVRIENAKKLIINSLIPIHNIALNVGFSDPNYFSKLFKRYEGIQPSELRKKADEGAAT